MEKDPKDLDFLRWLESYLVRLRPLAGTLQKAAAATQGLPWRVEESEPGRFEVRRGNDAPDAVQADERMAYLVAATLTATGNSPPRLTEDSTSPPLPGQFDEAAASRLVAGLIAQPAAIELLFQAADTETLLEIQRILEEKSLDKAN